MNTDRLLREVETRLAGLDATARAEVLDALREEIARERRRVEPELTVEAERRRRVEAETLREVLEAIHRPQDLAATLDEVLKQVSRLVACDSSVIALLEGDGGFRVQAARGLAETHAMAGRRFRNALTDELRDNRAVLSVADVDQDERFSAIEGLPPLHSWCGVPLLVEGDVVGVLTLARDRVDPFEDDELHSAKAVAFSAAAAIRRAELHQKVRRYAVLMEQLVAVDQAVFTGADPLNVARLIVGGAGRIGNYRGGFFILQGPARPQGAREPGRRLRRGRGALGPDRDGLRRNEAAARQPASCPGGGPGRDPVAQELYLVPLRTEESHLGTLALIDPDGESADDRLMEAFASRAASAYLFAARGRG